MRTGAEGLFVPSRWRRKLVCSWRGHRGVRRAVPSMKHWRCRRCALVYKPAEQGPYYGVDLEGDLAA